MPEPRHKMEISSSADCPQGCSVTSCPDAGGWAVTLQDNKGHLKGPHWALGVLTVSTRPESRSRSRLCRVVKQLVSVHLKKGPRGARPLMQLLLRTLFDVNDAALQPHIGVNIVADFWFVVAQSHL